MPSFPQQRQSRGCSSRCKFISQPRPTQGSGGTQSCSSRAASASVLLFSLFFLFLSFLLLFPLAVGTGEGVAGAGSLPNPSRAGASLRMVLDASPKDGSRAQGSAGTAASGCLCAPFSEEPFFFRPFPLFFLSFFLFLSFLAALGAVPV